MERKELEKNYLIVGGLVYSPHLSSMEGGGIRLSLRLSDGRELARAGLGAADPRPSALLELLREDVRRSGLRPRCDHLDPEATRLWRELTGGPPLECLVSACLAGERCRYDGGANRVEDAARLVEEGRAFPVCPEVCGGLPTPRPPCEYVQGRVVGADGADRTAAFAAGARLALAAARALGVRRAVLKERSPSCGVREIYDGSFTHKKIPGSGLTASLLKADGIALLSEEDLP